MLAQHVLKSAAGTKQDLDWPSNRKSHTVVPTSFAELFHPRKKKRKIHPSSNFYAGLAKMSCNKPQEKERLSVYAVDAQCSNTIRVDHNVSQMSKLNVIHFADSIDICQMKFLQLGITVQFKMCIICCCSSSS